MAGARLLFIRFSFFFFIFFWIAAGADGDEEHSVPLVAGFYQSNCPKLHDIVQGVVQKAVEKETRMAASLLRLHFHDCFVNGCDASVLLDDTPSFTGEKNAAPNKNSIRGFEVIDEIKTELETECPGVVSCADIIAIAARDSVVLVGGPSWDVLLGRRDSLTASQAAANASIPSPLFDVPQLLQSFQAVGLTLQDMVTLSGSHTIGQAHCFTFSQRLYNHSGTFQADPTMQSEFLLALKQLCPKNAGPDVLASLEFTDPTIFNNHYYTNLVQGEGLLKSDQVLFTTTGITQEFVQLFSSDQHAFFANFAASMVKMGNIKPLTGDQGEIRSKCRFVNDQTPVAPPVTPPLETVAPPVTPPLEIINPTPAPPEEETVIPPPPPLPVDVEPPPFPQFPF